jgi:hydrogenase maturation protein HypF
MLRYVVLHESLLKAKSTIPAATQATEHIRVRGVVQGVGFRPVVWKLAQKHHLAGMVCNDGDGVIIQAQGTFQSLNDFVDNLTREKPKLARIDVIERQVIEQSTPLQDSFTIVDSVHSGANTSITADAATCAACLNELFDKTNRHYAYPFTNCTHCGPRLSIIRGIPYDRQQTSMAVFSMCPDCQREYDSPDDRRFHAQPNACPECGPHIWLENSAGKLLSTNQTIKTLDETVRLLRLGYIVAIKGIGGIHLAVDATNEPAVQRLRDRKHRLKKPFALMARDIETIRRYCHITPAEQDLLESSAAPVVLLPKRLNKNNTPCLANSVAPEQNTLGFMLPYTPLHHLLMAHLKHPIVLTSGNHSHAPQCIENNLAKEQLDGIADYWLLHNRKIENRLDDSVVRLLANTPQLLRRARGYTPESLPLPGGFSHVSGILAMGGELKNTFCLINNGQAILSQHMGDLENFPTFEDYQHNLSLYRTLFQFHPEHIAIDMHPDYLSSKTGIELAHEYSSRLHPVQHHHAHVAACLADNQHPLNAGSVLGIVLDGLGYGDDDTLWGGEFLLADYAQCQRLACLKPVALPGGNIAMKQPWRNTYAHLKTAVGWQWIMEHYPDLPLVKQLETKPLTPLNTMIDKHINSPLASSTGRLFDAVAAALNICPDHIHYEGQAAIELENQITEKSWQKARNTAYIFNIAENRNTNNRLINQTIDPAPLWKTLLQDLSEQVPTSLISARFHKGLSNTIQTLAVTLATQHELGQVVLSGGVFQNKTLFEDVKQGLEKHNLTVLVHQNVPANDGGLALGQAVIAAARHLSTQSQQKARTTSKGDPHVSGNTRSNH